jgi:microcystin-dependent protein
LLSDDGIKWSWGDTGMLKKYVQRHAITPAIMLTAALFIAPVSVFACGDGAYTGQVCVIAGSYCPQNTLPAEGQMLPISGNEALYSLLGITYGGDARTNFALPDLRGRAPVGQGQGTGLSQHNVGAKFGNETITQTLAQMPLHTHAAVFTPSGGGTSGAAATVSALSTPGAGTLSVPQDGSMLAASTSGGPSSANIYAPPGTTGSTVKLGGVSGGGGTTGGGTVAVGNTGSSQSMTIVPPELAIRYCIVTDGLYPERPN